MSFNTFGNLLKLTIFGESHGNLIGCILDGILPETKISLDLVNRDLQERAPNSSLYVSQRKELDRVEIVSGVFNNLTTGSPIAILIKNNNQRPQDYEDIKNIFRPSHADFTYQMKYGIRDYRGGGSSSARETALRVGAASIAMQMACMKNIKISGKIINIGGILLEEEDQGADYQNLWCSSSRTQKKWEKLLTETINNKDSLGAMVEIKISGMPIGLGEPTFGKLDSALAFAIMSIPGVKSFEIGSGINSCNFKGSEHNDAMVAKNNKVEFLSNNSGGILGGISNGNDIIIRYSIKPTSSIALPQKTITNNMENTKIEIKGRHDPCIGIRSVPVAKAMCALTIADFMLISKKYL